MKINVLVAGTGGASLGTEIIKCLKLNKDLYNVFACDISSLAYGLHDDDIKDTFVSDPNNYYSSIEKKCIDLGINIIVPGGEQPMSLLTPHISKLAKKNIKLASNDAEVVELCSDKIKLFQFLKDRSIKIPRSFDGSDPNTMKQLTYPCVIKPSKESGGSAYAFLVENENDASIYAHQIKMSGSNPIFQEYLPLDQGEYTFSILSDPVGNVIGGAGLKKNFDTKLLYTCKSEKGLISSGYSQGLVGKFPGIFEQVCQISRIVKSKGPLNIEGRVVNNEFIPFEINPRFSATTYLWAIAGFNDVDYFIKSIFGISIGKIPEVNEGYCLRSFTEKFIPYNQ